MKSNVPHNAPDELLAKFAAGEANEAEVKQLTDWAGIHPDNRSYQEDFTRIWEQTGDLGEAEFRETDIAWEQFQKKIKENRSTGKRPLKLKMVSLYRLAAVLALLLVLGAALVWLNKSSTNGDLNLIVENVEPQSKRLLLPDSSRVALNSYSKIEYPTTFDKVERRIKLKGEAYFEVKPQPDHPFVVEASQIEISVLGTAFNVNEDTVSQLTLVDVKEGRVEVAIIGKKANAKLNSVVLQAGERATFRWKALSLETEKVPAPYVYKWQMDELDVKQQSLTEITRLLSEVFQTEIKLANPQLGDTLWSADLRKLPLDSALNLLQNTHEMKVIKEKETYVILPPD